MTNKICFIAGEITGGKGGGEVTWDGCKLVQVHANIIHIEYNNDTLTVSRKA